MSTFEVKVRKLTIKEHKNADSLEIALVDGYQSCVKKNDFADGSYAVYIPEQAIVPEWLLKKINLWDYEKNMGMLSGTNGQRVKIIKLRKQISQGLVYPLTKSGTKSGSLLIELEKGNALVKEDQDVTELLGITKWEPTIPAQFGGGGRVRSYGSSATIKFDVENVKKYNKVLEEGEEIVAEEKNSRHVLILWVW